MSARQNEEHNNSVQNESVHKQRAEKLPKVNIIHKSGYSEGQPMQNERSLSQAELITNEEYDNFVQNESVHKQRGEKLPKVNIIHKSVYSEGQPTQNERSISQAELIMNEKHDISVQNESVHIQRAEKLPKVKTLYTNLDF